jgi:hypothetical protein
VRRLASLLPWVLRFLLLFARSAGNYRYEKPSLPVCAH